MKSLSCVLLASILAIVVVSANKGLTDYYTVNGHNKQVVCYWGTWATYRPKDGKFTPDDIDPALCTNLIYSFAGLDAETSTIKSLDPWMDLEENYALAGFRKATELKHAYPNLKVTLAIGGWNEGSKKYSDLAADPEKRKVFVQSVVDFLQQHNFDGLDLDWEYPAKRGGIAEDKNNFIELIRDLKSAFESHNYLLTAAIGAPAATIDISYDIPLMYKYLDFVHIMCYDYHGKWDRVTGHNSPLFSRTGETGLDLTLNVDFTIKYLMKKGAIAEKTVIGVPFYGRAFTLMNPHDHDLGSKTKTTSFQGPYTREDGFLGYNEICEELMEQDNPWTTVWNEEHKAPYMFKDTKWVSFDNEESIRIKSEYAYDNDLAGVMIWSIDTDDFRGNCGGPRFPLLRTINRALYKRSEGLSAATSVTSVNAVVLTTIVLSIYSLFQL
uniref:chitinase n=1 Tax=Tigriopus japonicus TaxID=158387 RepID=A0A1U9XQU7_TIGJA|nr:chitinase 2 [Tigriopus japonicus]